MTLHTATTSEMDMEITQLQAVTHTIHLLHHRNKNQHRHSKWWKWVSMFRRCLSKLMSEIQARDSVRAQARVIHMKQVLLPRCYASFIQLIHDSQFSTLGLTLVAELSRIRRLMPSYTDRAEDEMGSAAELVDKATYHLGMSGNVGEAVGRTTSSNPTDVGMCRVRAFDVLTGPERGSLAQNRLREREGANLDATEPANGENELSLLEPNAGAVIAGLQSQASLAPISRQRKRRPVNAIDDIFQDLK